MYLFVFYFLGSRLESSGRRVTLDIKNIPSFSLFPGQIVMVKGINSSGRCMVASEIIEGIPKPLPRTIPSKLLDYHQSPHLQGGAPLHVMVACGPFTTTENLNYDPFQDLLSKVLGDKPDLVILIGPFVDVTQPLLASGDASLPLFNEDGEKTGSYDAASYEMIFRFQVIRDGFNALFDTDPSLHTQVVIIPSLNDGFQECVYPQPPIGDRDKITSKFFEEPLGELNIKNSTGNNKRVHLLPNPCMFRYASQ